MDNNFQKFLSNEEEKVRTTVQLPVFRSTETSFFNQNEKSLKSVLKTNIPSGSVSPAVRHALPASQGVGEGDPAAQ